MPSPEFIERAKKFQRVFAPYFPELNDNFHAACVGTNYLWHGFRMNPLETVQKQQAKRDLQKLADMIRRMVRFGVPYWMGVSRDINEEVDAEERAGKHGFYSVPGFQEDILDFLLAMNSMYEEGLTDKVLAGFVEKANREIDGLPEQSNINWQAVHAVDWLRRLWNIYTDSDGPSRALNPASTFCRFLGDGFDFLEIDADPVSAFKRWAEAYPYK
jgi:hypothetical protein